MSPRRQRIIDHLRMNGPATSARLARRRDPRTRARPGALVAYGPQDDHMRSVMDSIEDIAYEYDIEQFRRAQREARGPAPWGDAFPCSRGQIRVNPEELMAFFEDYIALQQAYDRPVEESSDDVRVVLTRFLAFPAPMEGEPSSENGVEEPAEG